MCRRVNYLVSPPVNLNQYAHGYFHHLACVDRGTRIFRTYLYSCSLWGLADHVDTEKVHGMDTSSMLILFQNIQ